MKKVPLKPGYYWHGYKIKLYPTDEQKQYIDRCIDLSRFVYNWAIKQQREKYQNYKDGQSKYSMYTVIELNKKIQEFRNDPKNSWLKTLPLTGCRYQILNVKNSYTKFFSKKSKNKRPDFKKKKHSLSGSYFIRPERMYFVDSLVKIDGLKTMIQTNWNSDWYGKYTKKENSNQYYISGIPEFHNTVLIRSSFGEYFLSFSVQKPVKKQPIEFFDNDHIIGIDLNVKDRFVCSNGYRSGSPNLKRLERHKAKKQSRYRKDIERRLAWEKTNPDDDYVESNRAKRRHLQYCKSEEKITNVVNNFIHYHTKKIINKFHPAIIVMEHLEVANMKKRHYVAQKVHHANFSICKQIMMKKCEMYDIKFIEADSHFPSSQLCSRCGNRYKIGPEKIYKCSHCGLIIDRDLNAALNLQKYAIIELSK